MNYSLLKLKFNTPYHTGNSESARSNETAVMTFCADTFFSALCHSALLVYGSEKIDYLYKLAINNKLLFSDVMPYHEETLYIPKPLIMEDISDRNLNKKLKKLNFIPLNNLDDYMNLNEKNVKSFLSENQSFGDNYVLDKVSVKDNADANPYSVGLFCLYEGSGLYVIIGYDDAEDYKLVLQLTNLIGKGGIGGKVSSGYGKFDIIHEIHINNIKQPYNNLYTMLNNNKSEKNILLTASLPNSNELESVLMNSNYSLIRRSGFVQSQTHSSTPLKKKTQYFLSAGSLLSKRFEGDVYNVSQQGQHNVYRYSKPMFLGVK